MTFDELRYFVYNILPFFSFETFESAFYDPNPICDSPTPLVYDRIISWTGFISFPVFILVVFIFYKEKEKDFKAYKRPLLFSLIVNIVFWSIVTYIIRPMPSYPLIGVRFAGIWPIRHTCGWVPTNILAILWYLNIYSIFKLLNFRMKIAIESIELLNDQRPFKFIPSLQKIYFILIGSTLFFSILSMGNCFLQNSQKMLAENLDEYPEAFCASTLLHVGKSRNDENILFYAFIVYVSLTNLYGICLIGLMGLVTLRLLRKLWKRNISARKDLKNQRIFLVYLSVQTSIDFVMLGIPALIFAAAVFFKISFTVTNYMMIGFIVAHGPCNAINMVIFNQPLRTTTIKMFRCLLSKIKRQNDVAPFSKNQITKF